MSSEDIVTKKYSELIETFGTIGKMTKQGDIITALTNIRKMLQDIYDVGFNDGKKQYENLTKMN